MSDTTTTPAGWTDATRAGVLTGRAVSDAEVATAAAVIEAVIGVLPSDDVPARDRTWIERAVGYQAAFIAATPDYFERANVREAGSDGQSAVFTRDGLYLAPLARTALRKLSWKGSRSVTPVTQRDARLAALDEDDRHEWEPI